MGEDHAGFGREYKKAVKAATRVRAVHAVWRDAAQCAVLCRSRSRTDGQVRFAPGQAPPAMGVERGGALHDMVGWSLAILEKRERRC